MSDVEIFARELIECSKTFLAKAKSMDNADVGQQAYLRSSLLNACCYLEAMVNYVSDHFKSRGHFNVLEQAVLQEREVDMNNGAFRVAKREKFYRIEDRLGFLLRHYDTSFSPDNSEDWGKFKGAFSIRNNLAHPREGVMLTIPQVVSGVSGIIDIVNYLSKAVFGKPLPYHSMGIAPKYDY